MKLQMKINLLIAYVEGVKQGESVRRKSETRGNETVGLLKNKEVA